MHTYTARQGFEARRVFEIVRDLVFPEPARFPVPVSDDTHRRVFWYPVESMAPV